MDLKSEINEHLDEYMKVVKEVLRSAQFVMGPNLADRGIGTMVYYPVPVHRLSIYKEGAPVLHVVERLSGEVLNLPIWSNIGEDVQGGVVGEISSLMKLPEFVKRFLPERLFLLRRYLRGFTQQKISEFWQSTPQ